ncbi:MAG: hypothetical protein LKI39_14985 [Bacteroides sp.]|nr:hypothetical protein [Bacteroides sp.]MCI1683837.1 hypothetical protein [Bacteroides sp.]
MYSNQDLEKLWFLYKLEGQPRNLSIEQFCLQQGIPYSVFSKWFVSHKKSIVPVEIVGIQKSPEISSSGASSTMSKAHCSSSAIQTVMISLGSGVQISKQGLSYLELRELVEKLEVLC